MRSVQNWLIFIRDSLHMNEQISWGHANRTSMSKTHNQVLNI